MSFFINLYDSFFRLIAKKRIEHGDIELWRIHTHNMTVVSTGILMWLYAFIALVFMESKLPGYIGITCSLLHCLSPLLFRFTNNILFVSSFMLSAGIIHQSAFGYFTGGYTSSIFIWFGILPMLAGIIAGRRAVIIWCTVVTIIISSFLGLHLSGHNFPQSISTTGNLLSHSLLVFGWILVATTLLYLFNSLIEKKEERLKEKNSKIDNLLKILLHDMSNSIHVLSGTLSFLKTKSTLDEKNLPKIDVLKRHVTFLSDTISSIKSMYVMDSQKGELQVQEVPINKSLKLMLSILDKKIQEKEVVINYDFDKNTNTYIFVAPHIFENQVLQNILTNAIKFSNPGGAIDIELRPNPENQELVDISFKDHGMGMPEELLENLFNPDYRTSRPGTDNEPGTGLGMHIIKNFIEKMKGSIKVSSAPDKGTEIIITFEKA